ncbi:MAG TPA: hypothetical protein VH703_06450 [Solirubrobacterales bacterium]|jgi:hypothetical protein
MSTMDEARKWEVNSLERRVKSVEERLDRRDRERFRNAMLLCWALWVAAIAGIVALTALN